MKGTKEMTKHHALSCKRYYGHRANTNRITFNEYIRDWGFLSITKTKEFLDPYFRFKLFSSAKFNEKKYEEDKEKILDYYNSQGYRDAAIARADTSIIIREET